ncbi:unnamed protein product [Calypogeia fissa]
MAYLNPVACLCYRHQSAVLLCNFAPRNEVLVQAVGTVFASASADLPLKPSGPVRYVQKRLTNKEQDGSKKSALETRNKGLGSIQPDSADEGNSGESNTSNKRGNPSRGTGSKSSSNSRLSTAFPAVEGKSTTRSHIRKEDEVEDGGQDTANLRLDARELLCGETLKTYTDDLDEGKRKGQNTDKDPRTSAKKYVMGLLARGPQTESNLRSKLVRKNVPPEIIDETINYVQTWGLQSDEEYADAFARSRWADNTWGPKRIKYELLRRGIRTETVAAALVKLFQTSDAVESNEEEEEDLGKWGMTTEAAEHLIAQAGRRWCKGDVKEVKRRRMIGWLQRRGFQWSIILDILKAIESEGTT